MPKTLVILTPGFPTNEADCNCITPQQLFVKALKDVSPHLNIIVLTFQYPFLSGTYYWHGIKVIAFGNRYNSRAFSLFTSLKVWHTLKKIHRDNELIGTLSFWFGKCALTGSRFQERFGVTHFSWILGQDAKKGNKYVDRINPRSESLIALSDFIKREFEKNYKVKPKHLIPVGIDVSLFNQVEIKRDIDILGVGALIPLKQYNVFIDMIGLLKQTTPTIKAIICGDGVEMSLLKNMVNQADLNSQITFTGRLPHREVLCLMQRSKVFLHPSNYEGFGAVCLEALYAGAKVVSFVKPMDVAILNWNTVNDKAEMLAVLKKILSEYIEDHQSILPYHINDNARAMLKLFGQY